MTSTFPAGTRVRVVAYPSLEVEVGSTGVVVSEGSSYISVVMDEAIDKDGTDVLFRAEELEVAYNFKVGDKLTVLEEDSLWSGFKRGDVVEVVKFPYDAAYPTHTDGKVYPFGTVQVKATAASDTSGHNFPLYVGVTHVAKYDQPEPDQFKPGDRVTVSYWGTETESVIKSKCDFAGVDDCFVVTDEVYGVGKHIPVNRLAKVADAYTPKEGDRVRVVVDDKFTREGEFVGLVGVVRAISEPWDKVDTDTHLSVNVEFDRDQGAPHTTWWVKTVEPESDEPTEAPEAEAEAETESYGWLKHGTWVFYKGDTTKVLQVFRDEYDKKPEDGPNVSTPLIGFYGTVEEQKDESNPARRWAHRAQVTELVPESDVELPAEDEPDVTSGYKVGDRVVVEAAAYAEHRVGQVGTITSVTNNWTPVSTGIVHKFSVAMDEGTGSLHVSKVSPAPKPVHAFAVGDRVEVVVDDNNIDKGKYVGKVGEVTRLSSDPETRLPYRVRFDAGQGVGDGESWSTWWVAELKKEEPKFEVGKRYKHPERTLERVVVFEDEDSPGTFGVWLEYPGKNDHDSLDVVKNSDRDEYTEV